jgi:hypothetical protein
MNVFAGMVGYLAQQIIQVGPFCKPSGKRGLPLSLSAFRVRTWSPPPPPAVRTLSEVEDLVLVGIGEIFEAGHWLEAGSGAR